MIEAPANTLDLTENERMYLNNLEAFGKIAPADQEIGWGVIFRSLFSTSFYKSLFTKLTDKDTTQGLAKK